MLFRMADWLQDNYIIMVLTSTGWTAALLAILHYFSMFVLVGSMAIVDMRVLGWVGRDQSATVVAQRIFPWVWVSLIVNLISGFIMYASDATAYTPDPTFHVKITVVLLAIIFAVIVQRNIPKWDQSPTLPTIAKVIAGVSLLFWVGAILMGAEVPAISGIG